MRKLLLSIVAASMTLAACNAQSGYKVTGTVEGMPDGKAIIATVNGSSLDTLAKADVKNGSFEFTGNVSEPTGAYIMVIGQRGAIPFMLENANITVNAGQAGLTVTGSEGQKIYDQFMAINTTTQQEAMKLQQEYQAANGDQAKMQAVQEAYAKLMTDAQAKETELIKANPDSYVSTFVIVSGMGQMEYEQLKERYNLLGEKAKASAQGKAIAAQIAKLESTAIGQIAPNFTITTPEGESISLYDIKGKVKLIDFWASWCGPCRGENPHVVEIYKEYHPKGLEIFGVSLDNNKEAWVKAIADDGLVWKHGSDLKGWQSAPAQLYSVSGIPHTVLLDENNKIIAKNLRGDELKQKIAELLK
ncbi:MAG TPA: AhpC/TSA family protein [Butyricimonas virosa]|jgi:thiol-disulfide isomerase/thioredoxin|uniref:AhpC/TSA family protein n=1 Tax=Butyricimonas virosa TaxID=544645 RepID=A0A921H6E8_9BACT|nr:MULTISPECIES: TlpA disulfide reductase family protein [Butyricimonas]MCI6414093.1 AhpC/TSA family protein [Butyricimonas virosa]MCI7162501.1 AhpC/TSA family protein [Butyricimonas virosa]MCI7294473.1 AhpC/TSA family protein [Butyricimonas virosa]MDY5488391.1 TlpA disulfide reductase family protein [Butyricimonas virosa]MDY6220501.1 TlpA disulfide reductase family protein [Butyricimonas virosa]